MADRRCRPRCGYLTAFRSPSCSDLQEQGKPPFCAASRDHVRSELALLLRSLGIPAIVVTHDWVDALTLGDQMLVMSGGRVLQTGPPQEVFTRPQHREVAAAVGVETVVAGRVIRRDGGIAFLQVGSGGLAAADPGGDDVDFYVCIRGEDVTLE